jgi:hypothetical protein
MTNLGVKSADFADQWFSRIFVGSLPFQVLLHVLSTRRFRSSWCIVVIWTRNTDRCNDNWHVSNVDCSSCCGRIHERRLEDLVSSWIIPSQVESINIIGLLVTWHVLANVFPSSSKMLRCRCSDEGMCLMFSIIGIIIWLRSLIIKNVSDFSFFFARLGLLFNYSVTILHNWIKRTCKLCTSLASITSITYKIHMSTTDPRLWIILLF